MKHPRTHRWYRPPDRSSRDRSDEALLDVDFPPGAAPPADRIDAAVADALAGWPIIRLRLGGELRRKIAFGRNPGPRIHGIIANAVDGALCTCGERCVRRSCPSHQLLGRHEVGPGSGIGDPWAPLALRVSMATHGKTLQGATTRIELVLAGPAAHGADRIVAALGNDLDGDVDWKTIQYIQASETDEPRWRSAKKVPATDMLLPLDRVSEPRLRSSRLTWAFRSPTPLNRLGERGRPHAAFPVVLDRAGRGLATWMHRTGHRGPRLPAQDLLRAARSVEVAADHTRVVELETRRVGGVAEGPESVGSLLGNVTWKGDFTAFARLLRAVHYVGMGPARAHGFGEVELS